MRVIIGASTMPGTASASRSSSARIGTQLRTGQLSSLRERMGKTGRGAFVGLSMLASHPAFQRDDTGPSRRDPVAQMHESRHAKRQYSDPVRGSLPQVADMRDSLEEGGMTNAADELNNQATQSAAEGNVAKARSGAMAAKNEGLQKMADMAKKKFEELMAEIKFELTSKFLSLIDWGNKGTILDGIGTALSGARSTLSIFQNAMSDQQKALLTKMGMPMMKFSKGIGVPAAAATVTQYAKWTTIVGVIIPFLIVFQAYMLGVSVNAILHPVNESLKLWHALLGI